MAGLSTGRQNGMILAMLLFGQLLIISGSVRGVSGSTKLESWVMHLTAPVLGLADSVTGGAARATTEVGNLFSAHARNRTLETEIAHLRAELESHREASAENLRLRRMLEMSEHLAPRSVGASVIHAVVTDQMKMMVVDRGEKHGVRADLPVVTWGGAVGRVVAANENHAKVRLLSDPNSGVGGVVQRSRANGVVVGRKEEQVALSMGYVPRFADVAIGDRVVTSGLDGVFPRGFGIGEIVAVREKADGTRAVELRAEVDYRSLEEVLILIEPVGGELLAPPADDESR